MKKKLKALVTVMVAGMMILSFTACGGIDASALVKANLDMFVTGEITDEILDTVDSSKEELQQQYDTDFNDMMNEIVGELDCDDYINNGGQEQIEQFMKKYISIAKYDVAPDATKNDDGSYTVTVTAYPANFGDMMTEYVQGDFVDEWLGKVMDGSYKYTTEAQLMNDMYGDLFPKLTAMLDDVEYGDGEEMTVTVSDSGDKKFVPNAEDLSNVLAKCLGL